LFIDYFTGIYQPKKEEVVKAVPQAPGYGAGAVNAVYISTLEYGPTDFASKFNS